MARMWNQVTYHWRDQSLRTYDVHWSTQDQTDTVPGGLVTLGTLLQACSGAKLEGISYTTFHPIEGDPSNTGDHPTIWDRLSMIGRLTGATPRPHYHLPGPINEVFDTFGRPILTADPLLAVVNGIIANIGTDTTHPVEAITSARLTWGGPQ